MSYRYLFLYGWWFSLLEFRFEKPQIYIHTVFKFNIKRHEFKLISVYMYRFVCMHMPQVQIHVSRRDWVKVHQQYQPTQQPYGDYSRNCNRVPAWAGRDKLQVTVIIFKFIEAAKMNLIRDCNRTVGVSNHL